MFTTGVDPVLTVGSTGEFFDNRDFESVKMRCRLKLDLTFLIRRLRSRGKNGFEALDEMHGYVLLDFSNSVPTMFEKQHFVLEIHFYYRDLRFYSGDYPGSDRDPGGFF